MEITVWLVSVFLKGGLCSRWSGGDGSVTAAVCRSSVSLQRVLGTSWLHGAIWNRATLPVLRKAGAAGAADLTISWEFAGGLVWALGSYWCSHVWTFRPGDENALLTALQVLILEAEMFFELLVIVSSSEKINTLACQVKWGDRGLLHMSAGCMGKGSTVTPHEGFTGCPGFSWDGAHLLPSSCCGLGWDKWW